MTQTNRVVMTKDHKASRDGANVELFKEGDEHELPSDLAASLVEAGVATLLDGQTFPCAALFENGERHQHLTKVAAYDCMLPRLNEAVAAFEAYYADRDENDDDPATDRGQAGPGEQPVVTPQTQPVVTPAEQPVVNPDENKGEASQTQTPDQGDQARQEGQEGASTTPAGATSPDAATKGKEGDQGASKKKNAQAAPKTGEAK